MLRIFKRRAREEKGFTLIEMMVVMAIIGLIVAFAVPNITKALSDARIRSVESSAREIQSAFDQYYSDNPTEYPRGAAQTDVDEYDDFFKAGGILERYVSLPNAEEDAAFLFSDYDADNNTDGAETYEMVLEVKNVAVNKKYVHIKPTQVWTDGTSTESITGWD